MSFYLTPVTGELLINREKELDQILSELVKKNSRIGFSLTGVRRIGKTSILKEVKKRLEREGIVVIYISVWNTTPDTLETFIANLFDDTIEAFKDKFPLKMKISNLIKMGRDGINDLLKHLNISVDFGNEIAYTVSYVKGEESDISKATSNIFNLIDRLAEKTKTKCVLIIDEFPSLIELKIGKKMIGSSIIKTIRTINEDYKKTALVISGSFMHTMQEVALLSSAPFYKQLVNLEIDSLEEKAVQDFVKKYLKKKISKNGLDALIEKSSGIPYNLQMLGRELNKLKEDIIDTSSVSKAIDEILQREGDIHFKDYLNMMQSTEIKVVKTMAVSDVIGPKEIADAGNMKLNEVTALLQTLLDKGIVRKKERGQYQFTDNMFKICLNRAYS
jgi:AAA+ ATPase superfamily predicted ATPase